MPNQVEPIEAFNARTIKGEENVSKRSYFKLTFHQLLSVLITAAVPVLIGIYTGIATYQQIKTADERRDFDFKQATELQWQHLYNNFINDIYQLYKDGELNDTRSPWAFVNARFRVLHRRDQCENGCEPRVLDDIVRLNELNFDGVQLSSATGTLNKLKFQCVKFDHVSLIGATFANVDLSGTAFDHSQLNGVQFNNSLLACATFNGTHLNGTDFADSNLESAVFTNVNLSTTKLTPNQLRQATFINATMPNGTMSSNSMETSPITSVKSTVQISSTMETGSTSGDSSMTAESNTIATGTMSLSMEMTSAKSEWISISTTIAAITATTTFSTTTSTISTTPKATITTTTTTTTARTTGKTVVPTVTATIGASGTKTTAITNATISGATTTTTLTRRRLTSEDTVGENDPFVEIHLPNSRQKSSTNVVQDNRTPTWNQSFTFDVHPQDDLIVFDVKDKDLSNHDMIGSGAMKLKNVFDNGKFDEWITIHVSDGSLTTGEIHVIMNIEPS
ncbi:unnamed protein product [Rotaria magnacalcarata]|uniref:C2 domain-containing protein n=1 Tax=Rotaria magnacalcarata TaxID=392030 RepID=A0A816Z6R1_9BILA|nr:unnamed protein product [Rotaria magnacalcarata]